MRIIDWSSVVCSSVLELDSFVPEDLGKVERTKPWGTAHAVLCAKNHIDTPFAVINADDFYGYDAFEKSARFLSTNPDPNTHAVVGYRLDNTLDRKSTRLNSSH